MKTTKAAILLLFFILSLGARAKSYGGIIVDEPWVRAAPPNAHVMAAFMTLQNRNEYDVHLIEAKAQGFAKVELHQSINDNGVMKMLHLQHLQILGNTDIALKPSGYHLMLIKPNSVPTVGEEIILTLYFDDNSQLTMPIIVKKDHQYSEHNH